MGWLPGSGCVLWLQMDERQGSIAYDLSGNNNHGTIYGPTWKRGKIGYCLNFDGVDDYVNLGIPTALYQDFTEITLEFWIFLKELREQGSVNWHNFVPYGVHLHSDGTASWVSDHSDGPQWLLIDALFSVGKWQHMAITYKLGTTDIRAFLNGTQIGIATPYRFGVFTTPSLPFYIGARWVNFQHFWGSLDEVRIYNRALSAQEIEAHYWYGIIPAVRPPQGRGLSHGSLSPHR